MGVCTIHLLRHAEHSLIHNTLAGRKPGIALSEAGRLQAAVLAKHYAGADVRSVLTSPVQRARETAQPIASTLGRDALVEPGIEEVDFGRFMGQRFDALANEPAWAAWNATRSLAGTPGGETMLAVQARAVAALMRQREAGGTVIAVSHADVIKAVLAFALGMPLDLIHRMEIAAASRSVLVLGDDFARVEAMNLPLSVQPLG